MDSMPLGLEMNERHEEANKPLPRVTFVRAMWELGTVAWYGRMSSHLTESSTRRTSFYEVMTATGVLSALFFGFSGGSIWLGLDEDTFRPGWERGIMVLYLTSSMTGFMLSAVWSVLMLMFAGLMHDYEFNAFLAASRWLVVLPLLLFLVGVVFVAAALATFLVIALAGDDWPYLVACFVVLGALCANSIYAFVVGIAAMYDTRNSYTATQPVSLTAAEVDSALWSYHAAVGEGITPAGFEHFLVKRAGGTRRLAHITSRRVEHIFDAFVERTLKSEGLDGVSRKAEA